MTGYPSEQQESDYLHTALLEYQRDTERLTVELTAAQAQLDAAITFIKELNATKYQHGRQYRSRCGQFLSKLQ